MQTIQMSASSTHLTPAPQPSCKLDSCAQFEPLAGTGTADQEAPFLYQQLVEQIRSQIEQGHLNCGDRLPSLRAMGRRLGLSIPTVRQAYLELERQGLLEARPKSGYFVDTPRRCNLVRSGGSDSEPRPVRCRLLLDEVYAGLHHPGVLPLGIANPSMALPATKSLHRAVKRVMQRTQEQVLSYAPSLGEPSLRSQLAFRHQQQFESVTAEQVIITNGAQEALSIALLCCAQPGAIVAVEAPSYHGHLELIESLGMLALEIATDPLTGLNVDALEAALERHPIQAVLCSSALNNPLGSLSTDAQRARLVRLVEGRNIALIEDDVYGELIYSGQRPPLARCFSQKGLVLSCSSFAKTLAPGYRIGWLLAGAFHDKAARMKRALSCSSGLLQQLTIAEFIASGEYERYLKRLLPVLKNNAQRMRAAIEAHFPSDTRVSQPQGGSVLWLEFAPSFDANEYFRRALEINISLMPGSIFGADQRFRHYLRLSYGHPWTPALEHGLERLGQLARAFYAKTL